MNLCFGILAVLMSCVPWESTCMYRFSGSLHHTSRPPHVCGAQKVEMLEKHDVSLKKPQYTRIRNT